MNNDMEIMINGQKIPVSRMKHWRFSPESFVPNRSEDAARKWSVFMGVKRAWELLDPEIFMHVLSPNFSYSSYWVNDSLDRPGYQNYITRKFETIRRTNSGPKMGVVVLYEGIAPEQFYYALHMEQGDHSTLLTFKFDDDGLVSLYMTDPQIFTFEPTFAKGGIVGDDGEPRLFKHECEAEDVGKALSESEIQRFAVECVEKLLRESGAEICGSYKSPYKEFPNIITKSGPDTFYHRIDVSLPSDDGYVIGGEIEGFVAAAKMHDAWPMVMPVSMFCSETNGEKMIAGGRYFLKCLESRRVE